VSQTSLQTFDKKEKETKLKWKQDGNCYTVKAENLADHNKNGRNIGCPSCGKQTKFKIKENDGVDTVLECERCGAELRIQRKYIDVLNNITKNGKNVMVSYYEIPEPKERGILILENMGYVEGKSYNNVKVWYKQI
jgi:Zn ribbon nucleic-acid-binding protein